MLPARAASLRLSRQRELTCKNDVGRHSCHVVFCTCTAAACCMVLPCLLRVSMGSPVVAIVVEPLIGTSYQVRLPLWPRPINQPQRERQWATLHRRRLDAHEYSYKT